MPNAPKWILDTVERLILPKLPKMKVLNILDLSPGVRRIRFKGDFKDFVFKPGSYMDIRVSDTEVRRYTAAYGDTQAGIMDFIVHLHGKHPGSEYMGRLKMEDVMNSSILKHHKYYEPSRAKYVFFGDETSLALACSLFPVLEQNNHEFQFYLELDEDNWDVPELLNLKNYQTFSKRGFFQNEKWLVDTAGFQKENWNGACFILTGNTKSVQAVRKMLKGENYAKIVSHGYWLEGKKGL